MAAKFNVFEGARRTLYLLQAVWALGVVVVVAGQEPYLTAEYVVSRPGAEAVRSIGGSRCSDDDARRWEYAQTRRGRKVSVSFCFTAHRADNGAMVIPYKTEPDGRWWGENRFGQNVSAYTEAFSRAFRLPSADDKALDAEWWPARWQQIRDGAAWLFGGCALLWVVAKVIGWVVRGFMGIPTGSDYRPDV